MWLECTLPMLGACVTAATLTLRFVRSVCAVASLQGLGNDYVPGRLSKRSPTVLFPIHRQSNRKVKGRESVLDSILPLPAPKPGPCSPGNP